MDLSGPSYDNLMGTVNDAEDHPANNLPEMDSGKENNPMNPANEMGMQPMKPFSSFGKKRKK